ncbi:MAG: hypothetical protein K2I81_00290 [Alphaproteobacteria bacterium]|nr:hypothetical protein [Alphaproteobacteria bacterium]
MKKFNQFSSENMLMSVGGHLALVAIMVTSFALVVERARLVAPDRVEITEIDLSAIKVSGDETRLYNTAAPVDKAPDVAPEPPKPSPVPEVPAPVPEPIAEPSLTEPEPVQTPEKKVEPPKADAKVEDMPAPRKKTVVRVNRETVSLDRTLTISVVDALRVAMTRCWTIDTTRSDISDIRAVAHLTMRQNGTVRDVWFEGAAAAETNPAFAYVLDTIRAAINVCQPFRMLPPGEFAKWEKIQLTFYPNQGKVM